MHTAVGKEIRCDCQRKDKGTDERLSLCLIVTLALVSLDMRAFCLMLSNGIRKTHDKIQN